MGGNIKPTSEETGEHLHVDGTVEEDVDIDGESNDESVIMDFQFLMDENNAHDDISTLIDTGSTFSVIEKPKMVVSIRKSEKVMTAETNGVTQESRLKAFLPFFLKYGSTRGQSLTSCLRRM